LEYVLLDRFLSANIFADSRLVTSIDLSPAGNVLATGSFGREARICMSTHLSDDTGCADRVLGSYNPV